MRGFTYLELMVAISIMAVMMVGLYGAFHFNVETVKRARCEGEVSRTACNVLDQMSKDLESVFAEKGRGLVLEEKSIGGRAADGIVLMTLAGAPFRIEGASTDLKRVTYFGKQNAGDRGFSLYRREEGIAGAGIVIGRKIRRLARNVRAMEVAFASSHANRPDERHDVKGPVENRLPPVIRIGVTLEDDSGREHRFSVSAQPQHYVPTAP